MKTKPFLAALFASSAVFAFEPALAQETPAEQPQTTPEGEEIETIVVRGVFIPDEKRSTSEITSLVDNTDFRATGDSNAALALGRVPGITIARGRFAVVRGLNERYSNTTLNGSPLSSPEPLRRTPPLDLFPTNVLDSIVVQKTFSPEYSAEFGGGLVQLRTNSIPDEAFFEIGGSLAYDTLTTLQSDNLLIDGGGRDFLGFDDGTRNIPEAFVPFFTGEDLIQDLDPALQAEIGQALAIPELIVLQEGIVPPNSSLSANAGNRFDINDALSIGVIGTLGYTNTFEQRVGVVADAELLPDGSLSSGVDLERTSTTQNVGLNSLFGLGFDIFDNHLLTFTSFWLRDTEIDVREEIGEEDSSFEAGVTGLFQETEFFERQIWGVQFGGEHVFEPLFGFEADWRVAFSESLRDAPFGTEAQFEFEDGLDTFLFDDFSLEFSEVEESVFNAGVDTRLPIVLPTGQEVTLKGGYNITRTVRNGFQRLFAVNTSGIGSFFDTTELFQSRIDFLLSDATIFPFGIEFEEVGGEIATFPQAQEGELTVVSSYFGVDAQVTDFLRVSAGFRVEDSVQFINTFNISGSLADDPDFLAVDNVIEEAFVLPAATITWNFADNQQLRVGYSQTVTRPQFRELAPQTFIDTETNRDFGGNPFLVNTELQNFDIRWEYYFGRDRFITIGGFYKLIDRPIEEFFAPSGDDITVGFFSAPSAFLRGFELEYEQVFGLGDWFDYRFLSDQDLVVNFNYTFTDSQVNSDGGSSFDVISGGAVTTVAGDEVVITVPGVSAPLFLDADGFLVDGRSLQGQSDHILNLRTGLRSDKQEFNFVVNWASDRISIVENLNLGIPAVFEDPPFQLDAIYNRTFDVRGFEFDLGLRARNILGEDFITQVSAGGTTIDIDSFQRGRVFSASFKARY
ncbi:MAG: TonB-dependent receptor domain-containing protein [Maricaulaceae bacterium]